MADEKKLTARQLSNQHQKLVKQKYLKGLSGEISPELDKQLVGKERQLTNAIRQRAAEEASDVKRIKGVTEHIKTNDVLGKSKGFTEKIDTISRQPIKNAAKVAARNAKKVNLLKLAGKVAGKGLKALPLVGGAISALSSGDAAAAIPILGEADNLGPVQGSPGSVLEDPKSSPEARKKAIEQLRKR